MYSLFRNWLLDCMNKIFILQFNRGGINPTADFKKAKCEKYIYMLVSNISIMYFRFEAWIKGWQSINAFVSVNVVLLVSFSPSVGRSQL